MCKQGKQGPHEQTWGGWLPCMETSREQAEEDPLLEWTVQVLACLDSGMNQSLLDSAFKI